MKLLLSVITYLLCGMAHATIIFSQTPPVVNSMVSDLGMDWRSADDFSLTSSQSIKSVLWRGSYYLDPSDPGPDSFTLNIYGATDSPLYGFELIKSVYIGNSVSRINTGSNIVADNSTLYEYVANLDDPIMLAVGDYTLSLVNDSTNSRNWYWAFGSGGNGLLSSNGGDIFLDTSWLGGAEFYFEMSSPQAVPEPPTFWLVAMLFFALALRSARSPIGGKDTYTTNLLA